MRTARIFNTYGPRMRPDDGRVAEHTILGLGHMIRWLAGGDVGIVHVSLPEANPEGGVPTSGDLPFP